MPPLRNRMPAETETVDVDLGHTALPVARVTIRRSSRTRHVRMHVSETGEIRVSAPRRLSTSQVIVVVREKADWLADVVGRFELAARATEVDLEQGDPVRLLGSWVPARVERTSRVRARVELEAADDGTPIRIHIEVPADGDPYAALHRFYRDEARMIIEQRVRAWAEHLELRTGALSIRDQRTRWGSCTSHGDLSFNWRLVLAPMWVLDAIVVHELTHIDELNHSDAFWSLLDERYPRHREASAWLQLHGPALRITPTSQPTTPDGGAAPRRVRPRRGRTVADNQRPLF